MLKIDSKDIDFSFTVVEKRIEIPSFVVEKMNKISPYLNV